MLRRRDLAATLSVFMFFAAQLRAQVLTTLANFNGTNGSRLELGVIQGLDGNLYGTTSYGGANTYYGEVYKVSREGALTTVYSFCIELSCAWTDGNGGILQTRNGNLYGTTFLGGSSGNGFGNVFELTPSGVATDLAEFQNSNGANPEGALIAGTDGNFYGVTENGARFSSHCFFGLGCGSVFKVTPQGALSVVYAFCAKPNCTDGTNPVGSLVLANDGNFYGTANAGGSYNGAGCLAGGGCGTIFKITPSGVFTTLHTFLGPEGDNPLFMALIQGTDGNLYGTTYGGGPNNGCNDSDEGCGTVFKISIGGTYTALYSFCALPSCADGSEPYGGLVQATDGNLYGTTYNGGAHNYGTIFQITPQGKFTTLYSFCSLSNCDDGEYPEAAMIQATDGRLYGTTFQGGTGQGVGVGGGTVFSFDLGLGPLVAPLPAFGKSGEAIAILGYDLQNASSVTFNGVSAKFSVVSSTHLAATVPIGAASGPIAVITPAGKLTSKTFQVIP